MHLHCLLRACALVQYSQFVCLATNQNTRVLHTLLTYSLKMLYVVGAHETAQGAQRLPTQ